MEFELFAKKACLALLGFLFLLYVALTILLFWDSSLLGAEIYSYYTDTYGVLAGIGGLLGFYISIKWGGIKSVVGRAVMMFSMGLFFQFMGQVAYGIHRYVSGIEDPYPGPGEVFYMLSIPIYIYGIWQIALAAGIKVKLKSSFYKLFSILAILIMVLGSYWLFLSHAEEVGLVLLVIEFWYPIGQALYVTLAFLALVLSNNILGGEMRGKVYMILIAFFIQYVADTYFSIEYSLDTFTPGGVSDLLYVISYFFMGLAIYKFGDLPDKLSTQRSNKK